MTAEAALGVTAVVVAWDDADVLADCLAALEAQDHPELEVVVVDNASADATLEVARRHVDAARRHPVRIVANERNEGLCGAVNRVLAAGTRAAVLLVNPDAVLAPDAVRLLAAELGADPRCGSVQPRLLRPVAGGPDAIDTTGHVRTRPRLTLNRGQGRPASEHAPSAGEVAGASGAAVLHRRAMLDDVARRVGGRTEWLTEDLVAYFEDVELDLRARIRGWTARYAPSAVGWHARAGASRRRPRRIHVLNVANHLLVTLGTEPPRALLRDLPVLLPVWLARLVLAGLRRPTAILPILWRLRLVPVFLRRGRADRARATVDVVATLDALVVPLPRGWVGDAVRRGRGGGGAARRPLRRRPGSYSAKNAK